MPAVRIVYVIPIPRTIGIADERMIFERFEPEKKTG
jgi:hypothetical protein